MEKTLKVGSWLYLVSDEECKHGDLVVYYYEGRYNVYLDRIIDEGYRVIRYEGTPECLKTLKGKELFKVVCTDNKIYKPEYKMFRM